MPDKTPKLDAFQQALARKPREIRIELAADPERAVELQEARRLAVAKRSRADRSTSEADIVAAEEAESAHNELLAETETFTFVFGGVGAAKRDELEVAHPPTADQQKRHQRDNPSVDGKQVPALTFNLDTYPPALIAASLRVLIAPDGSEVGPLTESQVRTLFESSGWTDADRAQLFMAALNADQVVTKIETEALGNG